MDTGGHVAPRGRSAVTIGQDPTGPLAMVRETRPAMGVTRGLGAGGGAG